MVLEMVAIVRREVHDAKSQRSVNRIYAFAPDASTTSSSSCSQEKWKATSTTTATFSLPQTPTKNQQQLVYQEL